MSNPSNSRYVVIGSLLFIGMIAICYDPNWLVNDYIDYARKLIEGERHKDLFPLDESDIWGTLFVILGLLVAASGGIGGGGILVPLYILVFGFSPKHAIPLSNFTIVGSSITNIVLNMPKRHPDANRPLVDWDLILVMEPLTMMGAIVGAFVSKILPDWILVISLVLLLAHTTYNTLQKGMSLWNKETREQEKERKSELSKALDEDVRESETDCLLIKEVNGKSTPKEAPYVDPKLQELIDSEKGTPMDKVYMMSGMVLVVIVLNLLKSGNESFNPLGIECGTGGYWFITILVFAFVLAVSLWTRGILIEKWRLKRTVNYKYAPGDVEWNPHNTIIYPCICFFAGFFAGLFGVGGGIVKGPLMLHMGINPLVASATVAVMIMFTSVAATTMFVAFGTMTWDYGFYLFILGLLSTIVGQLVVSYFVKKYNRVSLVSLSIGAVVALSTVLMAVQSVFTLMDSEVEDKSNSSSLCSK